MNPFRYRFLSLLGLLALQFTAVCSGGVGTAIDSARNGSGLIIPPSSIITGSERADQYVSILKGKRVAVVSNPTSFVGQQHLVDFLLSNGVAVQVVFAPEHGFRGEAGAGEKIKDGKDPATGVRVVSLYGKKLKPSSEDLSRIQWVIYDIQDVGARFYTYITTLQFVMEACADNGIPIMVLDRPNPNGHFVDGPVLDVDCRSFVGFNKIPIVHGCTVGEYACMLVGEHWLRTSKKCRLKVVSMLNYTHSTNYELPVRPSPNLPNANAIYLYPSLCLFEGTPVSLGRGTSFPFEVYGAPSFSPKEFSFTPTSIPGVATRPPYQDTLCYGIDLRVEYTGGRRPSRVELKWIIDAYRMYPEKDSFFTPFFDKLAGNHQLKEQLRSGLPEEEIRQSWQSDLKAYKVIRRKYLLYPDFE